MLINPEFIRGDVDDMTRIAATGSRHAQGQGDDADPD
jgi:hypothetical protein